MENSSVHYFHAVNVSVAASGDIIVFFSFCFKHGQHIKGHLIFLLHYDE